MNQWFPYPWPCYYEGRTNSIGSLYLSRLPIIEHLPGGVMSDVKLIESLGQKGLRTALFNPKGEVVPSETEILSQLGLMAFGIAVPSPR